MRNMTIVALAGFLVVGAGCMSKVRGASAPLSVSAKTVAPSAAPATAAELDLGSGITIARVRLALGEIGLEATASSASAAMDASSVGTVDDSGGHGAEAGEDPGEVKVGPFLVDLSGDALAGGTLAQVFDADVPAGTYRELRIVVAPVDPSGATSALADLDGRSAMIGGTIDGAPFTFSSRLVSAQRRESTLVVAADGSSSNVTLTISPAGWFRAPNGSRLDPTADGDRAAIEANLAASIDAFADDDQDGRDDRGGDGPGSRADGGARP